MKVRIPVFVVDGSGNEIEGELHLDVVSYSTIGRQLVGSVGQGKFYASIPTGSFEPRPGWQADYSRNRGLRTADEKWPAAPRGDEPSEDMKTANELSSYTPRRGL